VARKAEATLWMLVKVGTRVSMKRVVKKGRSYVPKVDDVYEPGSYDLCYAQNGKRLREARGKRFCSCATGAASASEAIRDTSGFP
jgi:hypothetical protein